MDNNKNTYIVLEPRWMTGEPIEHSAFFMVHLSHPYMTTGKTVAFTIWTFVSKLISLLFNMLSRFAKAFLPKSKRLLIS